MLLTDTRWVVLRVLFLYFMCFLVYFVRIGRWEARRHVYKMQHTHLRKTSKEFSASLQSSALSNSGFSFPLPLPSWIFFVNLFLSSVVDFNTNFHLEDQGKVGYLYHLQILLFNLQDMLSLSSKNASSSLTLLVLLTTQYYNTNNNPLESYTTTYTIHSDIIKDEIL